MKLKSHETFYWLGIAGLILSWVFFGKIVGIVLAGLGLTFVLVGICLQPRI